MFAAVLCFSSCALFLAAVFVIVRAEVSRSARKKSYASALEKYRADCLSYPTEQQGFEAVFSKPVLDPVPENWKGPYAIRRKMEFLERPLVYRMP